MERIVIRGRVVSRVRGASMALGTDSKQRMAELEGCATAAQHHEGRSWSTQPLPSGSSKSTNEFHRPPGPSTQTPLSMC
jgi:hypothetical protein